VRAFGPVGEETEVVLDDGCEGWGECSALPEPATNTFGCGRVYGAGATEAITQLRLLELVGLDPRYKEAAAWLKEMPR
jgi:hypothetical protein